MIVYELLPDRFDVVAPLFEEVWIDKALIDSVIEGTHGARIFVNDPQHPEVALMCCEGQRGDYLVIGSTEMGPVRQFIKDMPSEVGVFDGKSYAFFMPQLEWERCFDEDFGGTIPIFATRSFRFSEPDIEPIEHWRIAESADASVIPIDEELIDQFNSGLLQSAKQFAERGEDIAEFPGTELEEIARESIGFCVIIGTEIASVASASGLSSKYASLSTDTSAQFRRRGLATLTCAALIERCLELGLTPLWNCLESNVASAKTAIKLGMEEGPAQRESGWSPIQWHRAASTGLWTRGEASGVKGAWRRIG